MTLIKCDFDGDLPSDIEYRIGRLCDQMHWIVSPPIEMRKSRRGWHVVIDMYDDYRQAPDISAAMVVIAQLYLGSDRERELFNAMRIQGWESLDNFWRERWNVLYGEHVKGVD
jgi:hypothetical protein